MYRTCYLAKLGLSADIIEEMDYEEINKMLIITEHLENRQITKMNNVFMKAMAAAFGGK